LGLAPARAVRSITRRDPLRLRKPARCESYWLPKAQSDGRESYFSPGGPSGERPRGASRITLPLFYGLARLASPKRRDVAETRTSAAAREEGIPDEIYTLW
jgi:hypothetical protein